MANDPGLRSLGYQQIVGLAAATALTVPKGSTLAIITPEAQAVRWRDDGTDPSATVGYPLAVGSELRYDGANMEKLKFFQQAATANLNVFYYGKTPF